MQAFLRIVMEMPQDLSLIERPIVHVGYVDEEVEGYTRSEFMTVRIPEFINIYICTYKYK